MVRRAQLQRKTGSPLISGYLRRKDTNWGLIWLVVIAVVIVALGVWYFWLR